MSNDLYHQQILEIFKDPPHFGQLDHPDLILTETNASCGDSFTFYLKLSPDKHSVKNITFTGQGCAISTVSASLLIDHLISKPITTINQINQKQMETLLGITITPARLKCLMLAQNSFRQIKPLP